MKLISSFLLLSVFLLGCANNRPDTDREKEYLEKGQQIAAAVFTNMSVALQQAMEKGGVEQALGYCHLNALQIVDSLSQIHQAKIKRAAIKYRNPLDEPDKKELAVINLYQKEKDTGKALAPRVVQEDDGRYHFYAPIIVNDLCLKCHGITGETMSVENAEIIKKYYPDDLATGYVAGDLRGIWSIAFEK